MQSTCAKSAPASTREEMKAKKVIQDIPFLDDLSLDRKDYISTDVSTTISFMSDLADLSLECKDNISTDDGTSSSSSVDADSVEGGSTLNYDDEDTACLDNDAAEMLSLKAEDAAYLKAMQKMKHRSDSTRDF